MNLQSTVAGNGKTSVALPLNPGTFLFITSPCFKNVTETTKPGVKYFGSTDEISEATVK